MAKELTPTGGSLAVIRAQFGANLTDGEWNLFCQLIKKYDADPFKREIFAVKYGTTVASIFLGRDFFRRFAQEQESYAGLQSDAVYEKDSFSIENGIPKHSYTLVNRGKLIGAYALVYRKGCVVPYYQFVEFSEYIKTFGVWKTAPATMLKKVAEAQTLRGAFQGVFQGVYDESEVWDNNAQTVETTPVTSQAKEVFAPANDKLEQAKTFLTPEQQKTVKKVAPPDAFAELLNFDDVEKLRAWAAKTGYRDLKFVDAVNQRKADIAAEKNSELVGEGHDAVYDSN